MLDQSWLYSLASLFTIQDLLLRSAIIYIIREVIRKKRSRMLRINLCRSSCRQFLLPLVIMQFWHSAQGSSLCWCEQTRNWTELKMASSQKRLLINRSADAIKVKQNIMIKKYSLHITRIIVGETKDSKIKINSEK